jgi:hypothetical protein
MSNAISLAGRFSGILAFADGSNGGFHCEIDSCFDNEDLIWSYLESYSEENIQRLYNQSGYKAAVDSLEDLPFITSVTWADVALDDKEITDMVYHLQSIVAFDDETSYPISFTYERGEARNHIGGVEDLISAADNKSGILDLLENLFNKIMQSMTFV